MLLAHVSFTDGKDSYTDLCLVPIEESKYVEPTRIRILKPKSSGVFHIGPKEGIMVNKGEENNSIIITPLKPASLFLTPDTPTQPGVRVAKIKIIPQDNDFEVHFIAKESIDAKWQKWEANKVRS